MFYSLREQFSDFAVISKNFIVFHETGSVTQKTGAVKPTVRTKETINDARERMEQEPAKSLKHLTQESEFSYETCNTSIKKNLNIHPYKMKSYHTLLPEDDLRLLNFFQWFVNYLMEHNDRLDVHFFLW